MSLSAGTVLNGFGKIECGLLPKLFIFVTISKQGGIMNKIIPKPKNYRLNCGILIAFVMIFLSLVAYADDFTGFNNGDFLEKSAILDDKIIIKDKNYKTKGYLKQSVMDPRKTILYDTDDKPQGYFQKDVIDNRKIRFQETRRSEQNKGYLQPSVIDPRKTILYDFNGNSTGYFKKDLIDSRKIRFYEK